MRRENEFLKKQPPDLRRNVRDRAPQRPGPRRRPLPRFLDVPMVRGIEVRVLLLARPTRVHVRHQKERTGRDGEGYF